MIYTNRRIRRKGRTRRTKEEFFILYVHFLQIRFGQIIAKKIKKGEGNTVAEHEVLQWYYNG